MMVYLREGSAAVVQSAPTPQTLKSLTVRIYIRNSTYSNISAEVSVQSFAATFEKCDAPKGLFGETGLKWILSYFWSRAQSAVKGTYIDKGLFRSFCIMPGDSYCSSRQHAVKGTLRPRIRFEDVRLPHIQRNMNAIVV